ncbi:unnamed protein product [Acanthoscelides obtectus]|uniref:Uncharacterized protein n=1 Tax=Acanthoscelides obtectus TaxID=200917 RepID=A0A9P0L911_ACAOB|nr:unnamed protein product [Acanthoscelides obtectus]CAK1679653.1 hypothetical protein AOBTE_LOCUS32395 [Acanthoscelides obtectus]
MFAKQMLMKMHTNSFRTHSEHFFQVLGTLSWNLRPQHVEILVVHDFWSP